MQNRQAPSSFLTSLSEILFPWIVLAAFIGLATTCNAQPQEKNLQPERLTDRTFTRYFEERTIYIRFGEMQKVGPVLHVWSFGHDTGVCRELPTSDVAWIPGQNAVMVGPNRWDLQYDLKEETLTVETSEGEYEYKRAPIGERVRQKCGTSKET